MLVTWGYDYRRHSHTSVITRCFVTPFSVCCMTILQRTSSRICSRADLSERGALAGCECHGEYRAWPYNWGLQRGSSCRAPGGGQGSSPPEAGCLLYFVCSKEAVDLRHYWYLSVIESHRRTQWMKDSLFNDADASPSPTNLVTLMMSTTGAATFRPQ